MDEDSAVPVWQTIHFRKLLSDGQPGRAFSLVRKSMGLSQAAFAELLHWDRSHAGRVERGEVSTLFDIRELIRVTEVLGIPRTALLPLLLGTSDVGTIGVGEEGADDVDRRQFGLTAGVVAAVGAGMTKPVRPSTVVQVHAVHLTQLQEMTRRLWEHDNLHGSGGIVRHGFELYRTAKQLLDHGEYDARTGADLATATGWLSNTAAWLAFDTGNSALAQRQLKESVLLAGRSGDSGLLAAALGDLVTIAVSRPAAGREPVHLAQRAGELVRGVPSPRLNALRAANEATAHAAAGDDREFERAMTRVWREVDRGFDQAGDPAWLDHVTSAELQVQQAAGYKLLGRYRQAANHFRDSIDQPGTLPRDEASYRVYYAAALTGLGDITTALAAADSALALLEEHVDSPRLVAELAPVYTSAHSIRGGEADRFRRRYNRLSSTGARRSRSCES